MGVVLNGERIGPVNDRAGDALEIGVVEGQVHHKGAVDEHSEHPEGGYLELAPVDIDQVGVVGVLQHIDVEGRGVPGNCEVVETR